VARSLELNSAKEIMGCADSKKQALVNTISDEKLNRETQFESLQLEIEATFLHNKSSPIQENDHFSHQENILASENSKVGFQEVLSLGERPFERQIYKQQGKNYLFFARIRLLFSDLISHFRNYKKIRIVIKFYIYIQ